MSTSAAAVAGVRRHKEAARKRNQPQPSGRAPSSSPCNCRHSVDAHGVPSASGPPPPGPGRLSRQPTLSTFKKKRIEPEPVSATSFQTPTGATTSMKDTAKELRCRQSVLIPQKERTPSQRFALWWVIDPRHAKLIGYWDICTVLALLFVALVTPFEVAFLESPRSSQDIIDRFESVGWLFCFNRIVE